MPAILIEGGFMSNAADAKNIYDTAFRKRMAQAVVDGILAYKKAVAGL
jgi:N-acetylmuramoyl-L-alanine amidase